MLVIDRRLYRKRAKSSVFLNKLPVRLCVSVVVINIGYRIRPTSIVSSYSVLHEISRRIFALYEKLHDHRDVHFRVLFKCGVF